MQLPSLRRFAILAVQVCAFATGCNPAGQPPRWPAQGSRWIAVTSKHFVVLTDVDEAAARKASKEFETDFENLRAVAFHRTEDSPPVTIVLFDHANERLAFRPAMAAGEYLPQPPGDLERSPIIVFDWVPYAAERWLERELFLRDLTHRFIAYTGH